MSWAISSAHLFERISTTRGHILIIAWTQIILGATVLVTGLMWTIFWFAFGRHWHNFDFASSGMAGRPEDLETSPAYYLVLIGRYAYVLMAAGALPGIIAGIGILKGKSWARTFGIVVSVVDILLIFPIYIMLGIYGAVILPKVDPKQVLPSS